MIPQSDNPSLNEDTYVEESQFPGPEHCGQSRCGQSQTAYEVYQRILQRLQPHPQEKTAKANENELEKQIWLASFTGRPIQYRY
ncbi:ventrally expressed gene D protein [Drosophila eugracilis]|uniref:ventrally expressed gene D protein n=1 Tax=Drosophila eugracilis TaxID=29029 RepID=UPI0007E6F8A2|nr:ventrally expressed gene D protein [Drosophila eugracilis]XP_017078861.1 ventrally expressed gene D protein [Drosophila eugracilis]